MSKENLFSEDVKPNEPTPPNMEDKNYLEELVGEGKKFASPEDLAKGKAQADAFIEQLKREQAELREALSESKSIEEHLNDLRTAVVTHNKKEENIREMTPDPNASDPNKTPETPAQNIPSPDDIRSMVEQEVNRRQSEAQVEQNIDSVIAEAKRVHGDNYKQVLSQKAEELGSSPDEMFEIAKKNPNLFKSVMGLKGDPVQQQSQNRVFESVNTDALRNQHQTGPKKKYSDFEDMRKNNPQKYFSPEVQNEMFRLAQEIGPDFLNS